MDGYRPPSLDDCSGKPAIATFRLPFYLKMDSYFCRFWGSFWMDIHHPQWATTPENPQSPHSICHFTLKWLGTFAALGVILDGYPPPSMDGNPRKPTIANIPAAIFIQNGFVFLLPLGGHFGWISTTVNGRQPKKTHNRKRSSCHFHLKWLRTFAALGAILDGYPPPSMGDYSRTPKITFAPSLLFWAGADYRSGGKRNPTKKPRVIACVIACGAHHYRPRCAKEPANKQENAPTIEVGNYGVSA